jgi:hypothetical protein
VNNKKSRGEKFYQNIELFCLLFLSIVEPHEDIEETFLQTQFVVYCFASG